MWFPWGLAFARSHAGRWRRARASAKSQRGLWLNLEQLEDRILPSSYAATTVPDLIGDINAANKAGGSNTITLTAPTTSPYVLSAVDNSADGATGLPIIAKKDALTIIGNGDTIERSTSSGTPAFRLFNVASGASLTLQSVTLQNGLAFGSGMASDGGAILNQGTLVLSGATVQDNIAQGSDGTTVIQYKSSTPGNDAMGGGIWSIGSLTAENNTQIQNNQADGGKGVICGACYGCGCVPSNGGAGWGGGLFVAGGTVSLTGIIVSNNIALGGSGGSHSGNAYGGGIYMDKAPATLSSDTVNCNRASANGDAGGTGTSGNSYGGALYVAGGTLNLSGDTMGGNFAGGEPSAPLDFSASYQSYGGGIYVATGTVTLCNDFVENNVASAQGYAQGAGIYIASHAQVYIDATTLAQVISNTRYDSYVPTGTPDNINGPYTQQIC
jgi:hypothetical protein